MMVGFLTPSSGTACIEGNDILRDMDNIYPLMGCVFYFTQFTARCCL
jgi:ABC-type multidrug transport system ATPase subunit